MRKSFLLRGEEITALLLSIGTFIFTIPAIAGSAAEPTAVEVIPSGTHFLVRLDKEVDTGKIKVNEKFDARTLEPLETSSGEILAPGAKIRGHVSRVEPAGVMGRARLWLTFDDIGAHNGRLPLVAEVSSVPGDFSVRPGESKEGEIEARSSTTARNLEAAAEGAAAGAAAGASKNGARGAAMGAATGGVAAFAASSGLGRDLDLQKGTKLDLVLDRPLYLNQ